MWVIKVLVFLVGLPSYEPIALTIEEQHTLQFETLALRQELSFFSNSAKENEHYREIGRSIPFVSVAFRSIPQPPLPARRSL